MKSSRFIDDNFTLQVVDESLRYDHGTDSPRYYIVKAEWFWTRISEGKSDRWRFTRPNLL